MKGITLITRYAACSVAVLLLHLNSAASLKVENKDDAWKFLDQFGYMDLKIGEIADKDTAFKNFLMEMQYMGGLNQTGVLDEPTLALMNTPRCSVTDKSLGGSVRRKKRYAIQGSKWSMNPLTYGFSKFTAQMPETQQRNIFRKALNFWEDASSLTFREATSNPNINISFWARDHGDGYPFDGRGGVLAHAFYPQFGGQAHFDDDENWTDGINLGTNLLQVATHELGHSLGLAHSNVLGAIMYPYYTGYTPNPQLSNDDISGIQYLYGPKTTTTTTTTTTTRPIIPSSTSSPSTRNAGNPADNPTVPTTRSSSTTPTTPTTATTTTRRPSICDNPVVDAIVYAEGTTYAFSGTNYYLLNGNGIEPGYPRLISSNWPEIYGRVDAALYYEPETRTDSSGATTVVKEGIFYLFQGTRYYRYSNINRLDIGYPRDIRNGFPGVPDNVDAGFHWGGNARVFFFKDSNYYRYTQLLGTDAGYPRPISIWTGVPNSVSAAFTWKNGRTYFFKGTQYYRFDDYNFRVEYGFPRNTGEGWFGCSAGNLQNENEYDRNPFREVDENSSSRLSSISYLQIFMLLLFSVYFQIILNK